MPIKFVQWSNYCDAFVAIYALNDYTSLLRDDLAIDSTIYLSIYLSSMIYLSIYLSYISWQEDDEISAQYQTLRGIKDRDTISQMSFESTDSREPIFVSAIEIRRRLSESINAPSTKSGFKRDPEDPSASVLKEPWHDKGQSHF